MTGAEESASSLELADAKSLLHAIVDGAESAIIATRLDGTVFEWNNGAERLYGYSAQEMMGRSIEVIFPPSEIANMVDSLNAIQRGEELSVVAGTRVRADGSSIEVEAQVRPMRDDQGVIVGILGVARSVDKSRNDLQTLYESNEFLEHTQALGHIGGWRSSIGPEAILTCTPEMHRILGSEPETVLRNFELFNLVHPDDRQMFLEAMIAVRTVAKRVELEIRFTRLDGAQRWFLVAAGPRFDEQGTIVGFAGVAQDVTERKTSELQHEYEALHDQLTGLPNRALFIDRVRRALSRAELDNSKIAVLYLDLDRFKSFNEAQGNEYGDELLRAVAERLRSKTPVTDTAARFVADEFGLVFEHIATVADAAEHARQVLRAFDEPFVLGNGEARINASIGIAQSSPGISPEALVRDADLAMHRAKEQGRGRFEIYDLELRQQIQQRFALEAALRQALEHEELFLEYQPVASLVEPEYLGVEALIRWRHPELDVVQPDEFISLAEETGIVVPIGIWVLKTACRQLREWRDSAKLPPRFRVSVNVSSIQLHTPTFSDQLKAILEETGVEGKSLCIEITESILLEGSIVAEVLHQIRALGVSVSIDDFGTKYSSLSYLKRLAIDELKIDKSFVDGLVGDKSNRAIVAAILAVGRSLDLAVTAEGVETEEQVDELRILGCESAQGYYFSKSLSPDEAFKVIQRPPRLFAEAIER